MTDLNRPQTQPVSPTQAPATVGGNEPAAADVYRRAVSASPTSFSENPIGAMAHAVDKLGKAAERLVANKGMEGKDGLEQGEARLKAAIQHARANPKSKTAQQGQLVEAMRLLKDMQHLPANDPRRLKVSQFIVRLAGQLGANGIPMNVPGVDVRGLLRLAAQTVSRFGTPQDMQAAFTLESLLKASLPMSSVAAIRLRDALIQKFSVTPQAAQVLTNGWAVREAGVGEAPQLDLSARTLILSAQQGNPSLGILARAYWHDRTLKTPEEADSFVDAFVKVANQSSFSLLNRKYKEVRQMARRELQAGRIAVMGSSPNAVGAAASKTDESADMFAAVAVFGQADHDQLPEQMQAALRGFMQR